MTGSPSWICFAIHRVETESSSPRPVPRAIKGVIYMHKPLPCAGAERTCVCVRACQCVRERGRGCVHDLVALYVRSVEVYVFLFT